MRLIRKEGVPSFVFCNMTVTVESIRPIVEKIIQEALPEAFLVSIKVNISTRSSIQIFVDTDAGITIQECSLLSRKIGAYFDEYDIVDFSYELEVSSPGLNNPLILPRQYAKNIGRDLKVTLNNGEKLEGKLIRFDGYQIIIESETKNSKTKKKELQQHTIDLTNIKEAVVQVGKKKEKSK